jgi:hypothetical protein
VPMVLLVSLVRQEQGVAQLAVLLVELGICL